MKTLIAFLPLLFMIVSACHNQMIQLPEEQPEKNEQSPVLPGTPAPSYDTKILFVGNSLTFFNDMPDMVQQMANNAGKDVLVDEATVAGIALRHLVNNEMVIEKINSQAWNYVVLQSDDITAFPDMYDIEIDVLNTFADYILSNNSSSEIIYKMVWGLRNGVTVEELNGEIVYYSYEEYMDKIYDGTLYVANQVGLAISPVGWTWKKVRQEHPDIELFGSDNAHPSYNGSYLTAAVHYASIFKESCINNSFNGDLTSVEAMILRTAASNMVLDSLDLWNLHASTGIGK